MKLLTYRDEPDKSMGFVRPLSCGEQPHRFAQPVEAKPLPRLIEFPIQVSGESYFRYERVAKRAMREFVDHLLAGQWYETDGAALVYLTPLAVASAGRELEKDEVALLAFAIRDYRIAQQCLEKNRSSDDAA
jgi:hypothetical protein